MKDNKILSLEQIYYRYSGIGGTDSYVLENITLDIHPNDCLAIVGASGSGKTTLIQHFTGLLKPEKGRVLFKGEDIWGKKFDRDQLHKSIGIVFQFPETQLFEETVYKDVAFGPANLGLQGQRLDEAVKQAMEAVELDWEEFGRRSPFKLSEGEKRRAAIAGVLAMEPEVIVLDEPTAGLDPKGVRRISSILQRLLQNGKTVVIVTHNMDVVYSLCNRVLVLQRGKRAFDGSPGLLFQDKDLLDLAGLDVPLVLRAQKEFGTSLPPELQSVKSISQLIDFLQN